MSITRYRPVRYQPVTFSAVRPDPFLGLFDGLFTAPSIRSHQPAVRVERNEDGVAVHADLPGVAREDIAVSVTAEPRGTLLALSAVRHLDGGEQRLQWSADLGDVDPDSVVASLADGVLTLRAATRPGPVARTVEVTVAEPAEPPSLPEDTASSSEEAVETTASEPTDDDA